MSTASGRLALLGGTLAALTGARIAAAEPNAPSSADAPAKTATPAVEQPIRPPPFKDDIPTPSLAKARHVELGVHLLTISRPAADDVASGPSGVTYSPTLGVEVSLRLPIHKYFEVGAFVTGGRHHIDFDQGALGVSRHIDSGGLTTIWFGLQAMPVLPIGDYVRLYGAFGVGWGRFEFPQMTAQDVGRAPFTIKGRGSSFVTFPLGIGSQLEIVKNWLCVDLEFDVSPNVHNDGTSFVDVQAIDNGAQRQIGPLPTVHVTFTQSVGLTLLL
jgi:opacity protein-like surface antigen